MGNVLSSGSTGGRSANHVMSESETMDDASVSRESDTSEEFHDSIDENVARSKAKEEEMEEFRRQLNIKREQRKEILSRHRNEKKELETSLEIERKAKLEAYENNKQLRELLQKNNIEIPENLQSSKEDTSLADAIANMKEEFAKLKDNNNKLRRDLAESNSSLQNAYSDIVDLTVQNRDSKKQIQALKDVVTVSKTMISLREQQLNELKEKLSEIEQSLADREANMLSTNLRQEYERQLQNIRTLRGLYEERARLAEATRQSLVRDLEEQKILNQAEVKKCLELQTKIDELEARVDDLQEIIENKNSQISSCQQESRCLNAEMSAVNKLFSQVLLGYKNKQDLDKLVHRLEENHGLLTHMAERDDGSEASSALPKLLLELVSQVDDEEENKNQCQSSEEKSYIEEKPREQSEAQNTSAEEIVQNLPKVWRVLMELLSHQSTTDETPTEKVTTCYKSVETKSGPVLVPSVSQTYIRLKDLIIEKLGLIKEVTRMKQLNSHLETRLEEQERRLCLVTTELSKTWHVVGRLRRHHHQLHTHEKILKYELQQKRKLLNELKEELEYCREKWEQAREKNTQSERDWRKLRAEFSSRKSKSIASLNNSAESGYSDERPSDESCESNDEIEYITEPLIRSKKKLKSFETILDSSTDFNLAAEREDPASDMLDVADLPLDTQECDDNHDVFDSCNTESLLKSERVYEETEDEVGDITNESCQDNEPSLAERCQVSNASSVELNSGKEDMNSQDMVIRKTSDYHTASSSTLSGITAIDSAAILKSIREQNERLANKDKKLERLEESSAALLKKTHMTAIISEQIDGTLDHLLNRPAFGRQSNKNEAETTTIDLDTANSSREIEKEKDNIKDTEKNNDNMQENQSIIHNNDKDILTRHIHQDTDNSSPEASCFSQNGYKTDERFQKLEAGCSGIVKDISNTLCTDDKIADNLDSLHNEIQAKKSNHNLAVTIEDNKEGSPASSSGSEPSTTTEIDHEARFAARDLRLKRLEEQTKSLVNKVNKTTTKGVKIHYKLEELHNIYGSESSRAGTPSEENEDRPQNNDDETQE